MVISRTLMGMSVMGPLTVLSSSTKKKQKQKEVGCKVIIILVLVKEEKSKMVAHMFEKQNQ